MTPGRTKLVPDSTLWEVRYPATNGHSLTNVIKSAMMTIQFRITSRLHAELGNSHVTEAAEGCRVGTKD